MSERTVGISEDNLKRWSSMGYEIIYERGTVRLPQFRKTFAKDVNVTVYSEEVGGYVPYILPQSGKVLRANDVLPERADLALDEKGRVLHQGDFANNYATWLESWSMGENAEPGCEPIPKVINYISTVQDTFSGSGGPIEIGFDPKIHEDIKVPGQLYDAEGEPSEAKPADSGSSELMKMLLEKIDPSTAATIARDLVEKHGIPKIEAPTGGDEIPTAAVPADKPKPTYKELEAAPCGKQITKGYVAQHINHCSKEECGGPKED